MAEPVIISINPQNWITIVLIVAITYFVIGAAVRVKQARAQKAS